MLCPMAPDELPPSNPSALGLHFADLEWRTLLALLDAEPYILQVRVYGSRQRGVRRPKDPPKPVDIDLAIQVRPSYPGETPFTVLFDVKRRLNDSGYDLRLHIEDLTDSGSKYFADRQAGVLVLDRTATDER